MIALAGCRRPIGPSLAIGTEPTDAGSLSRSAFPIFGAVPMRRAPPMPRRAPRRRVITANHAHHLYWVVHPRSRYEADIVAADNHGMAIIVTTALRMAERIARCHNLRLARQHGITAVQFPEIWNVVATKS